MIKKQLIFCILTTLAAFALAGNAFAGDMSKEADNFEFGSAPLSSELQKAVSTHNYDSEVLAAIGSEAGAWNIDHVDPKALEAARNHNYDRDQLNAISTEAGAKEGFEQGTTPGRVCVLC